MKRILVTGGAGFIGSNFVRLALKRWLAAEIVVLDKLTYAGNVENLRDVWSEPRFTFVKGDIADEGTARRTMNGCDAVVNFAALTHVDRSILEPRDFAYTDVVGAMTLADVARDLDVSRFVQVSTDEVYGAIDQGYFDEGSPLNPTNPYSASKAGGDLLIFAYQRTFGLPALISRSSNNYGPYQHPEKFIPLCITNALEDKPVPIYGDGLQVRDWLFVEDNCEALAIILEVGAPGRVYNVGGECERENLDVARSILRLLGKPETLLTFVTDRPAHDRRYALRFDATAALGWRPRTPFDAGLERTVRWYVEHESWWRPLKGAAFDDYYRRQYGDRR